MKQRKADRQFTNTQGLKESDALSNMPPGCVYDILNMYYDSRGGRKTRRGYTKLCNIGEASQINTIYDYVKANGTQVTLVAAGTKIFQRTGAGAITTIKSGLTNNVPWQMTTYMDRVYMANGTDAYICYDGTSCFNVGISPPANAPVVADRAGGSLAAGEYHYYYTFYNSAEGWESNPHGLEAAAPSDTVAGAPGNATIRITLEAKADANDKVDYYRIYRTAVGVATGLHMIAQLDYATYEPVAGTGFYDDTGDADGTLDLEYDNDKPVAGGKRFVNFLDRLYLLINDSDAGPILCYSKNDMKSHAWPVDYFLPVPADGSNGEWLSTFRSFPVVYTGKGGYILDNDPVATATTPAGWLKQFSDVGLQGTFCSCETDQFVAYLSRNGFWASKPTPYSESDIRKEHIGKDIAVSHSEINFAYSSKIRTTSYETDIVKHIYWAVPTGTSTSVDYIYVFDYSSGQWTIYEFDHTVTAWGKLWYATEQRLFFGDPNGNIWLFDEGWADGVNTTAGALYGSPSVNAGAADLTDSTQSWTVNQFAGCYITIISGPGAGEKKLIASNTATIITCAAWTTTPTTASVYAICYSEKFCEEFWNSMQAPEVYKRMRWIKAYMDAEGEATVTVSARKDMSEESLGSQTLVQTSGYGTFPITFPVTFGTGATTDIARLRFSGKFHFATFKFHNARPGEYFGLDGYTVVYQELYDRTQ